MDVKKFLKVTSFALVGMAMMATTALAGNGDAASVTVNLATVKAATYDNGSAAGTLMADNVSFTLGTPYVNNDVITFTLSAGTFDDASYFLAVDNGTGVSTAPCGSTPFAQISGGNGSDTLTFRVTDDTAIKGGNCTTGSSALEAGTIYYLTNTAITAANTGVTATQWPITDVSSLTTEGTITLTAASTTSTNLALDTAGTKTTTLFQSYGQFTATVTTDADAVIDVEADRKLFTGAANSDTIVVTAVSDTDAEIDGALQQTIAGADAITVTLAGDMTGILSINDGTDNMTIDTTANTATITYTPAQVTALNGATVFGSVDAADAMAITYTITVDESTALDTRSFTATVSTDLEETTDVDEVLLSADAAGSWTMNGMQAKVPYLALNASGYLSFLKAVNESSQTVGVSIDAVIADYTDIANPVFTEQTVALSDLAANSITTISESDLVTALGLDSATLYHIALTITVNGPQNEIQITGFQKDAVGRTVLQVLYNTGNANDSRTWQ